MQQDPERAATAQEAKTIEYTTGLTPPTFETQEVFDSTDPAQPTASLERNKTKETREREKALKERKLEDLKKQIKDLEAKKVDLEEAMTRFRNTVLAAADKALLEANMAKQRQEVV